MLGRNREGAKIVAGKSEDSLTGESEGVKGALEYKLTVISGPLASVSNTVDKTGDRGCGERLLP